MNKLLEVDDLHVSFQTHSGLIKAVRGISFSIEKGETVGIVGESGCGKSVTAQSLLQLIPTPPGQIDKGSILFNGENLLDKSLDEMRKIRGREIGMIFQDPMTSLNPTMRIGKQIMEGLILHQRMQSSDARRAAKDLLRLVGIPDVEERIDNYPHQFSGGMRQRVVIAIALACRPKLLIADEPTTALDVTIQAQILDLLKDLQKRTGTSILLITHDLGVVAGICDRIIVMYAGQVVESGDVYEIFSRPKHPYTQALLQAVPRLGLDRSKKLTAIPGTPPDLRTTFQGCSFASRCPHRMKVCIEHPPILKPVACWLQHPLAKKKPGGCS
jgi:oligopeptide transport system ATP-binding protein